MSHSRFVIGIDVGGTNTDCALLRVFDHDDATAAANGGALIACDVVAKSKRTTSFPLADGVFDSIQETLSRAPHVSRADIDAVMIGTTHFVNAVATRSAALQRVAVVRLAGECVSRMVPPLADFPDDLRAVVAGYVTIIDGGYEYDGREICPVNEEQVKQCCDEIRARGIRCVAVVGIQSPLKRDNEQRVASLIRKHLADLNVLVTESADIASLGLLERENATILNAALRPLAEVTVQQLQAAVQRCELTCPVWLTQNDGTQLSAEEATRLPVFTFNCGPTNSLRGAAVLAKATRGTTVVIDIGGTTSDVGVLEDGVPRLSGAIFLTGGVRTNFSQPDVFSLALGGGTRIIVGEGKDDETRPIELIEQSVGRELDRKALCNGGDVLTCTDVAVGLGFLSGYGDKQAVLAKYSSVILTRAAGLIRERLETAIDHVKTKAGDLHVLLVGGGTILLPHDAKLAGANPIDRPPHFDVANAVGAALADLSVRIDRFVDTKEDGLEAVTEKLVADATEQIEARGGNKHTATVMRKKFDRIGYIAGHWYRTQLTVVARVASASRKCVAPTVTATTTTTTTSVSLPDAATTSKSTLPVDCSPTPQLPSLTFARAKHFDRCRVLSASEIDELALGCGVLGTGGGGVPYLAWLQIKSLMRQGKKPRLLSVQDLAAGEFVLPVGFMGAPSVSMEKLVAGNEVALVTQAELACQPNIVALCSVEVGGFNGLVPFATAMLFDVPVLDCDGMGRAFPSLGMFSPFIYGHKSVPFVLADDKGNVLQLTALRDAQSAEAIFRSAIVPLGCAAGISLAPIAAEDVQTYLITGTITQALSIGHTIVSARTAHIDPAEAVTRCHHGQVLLRGKVSHVATLTAGGFNHGHFILMPLGPSAFASGIRIEFQNEMLIAKDIATGRVLAVVPSLIAALDSVTGEALQCELIRYGLHVTLVVFPPPARMCTPEALRVVGPAAFGFSDVSWPLSS